MNEISDARLKAYVIVGTVGIAVILAASLISMTIHKGIERIKLTGTN